MRIAIHFNHDRARWAEKVDDPMSDDILPPEFETGETTVSQRHPQTLFGFGRVVAHRTGTGFEGFCCDFTTPNPLL